LQRLQQRGVLAFESVDVLQHEKALVGQRIPERVA
jgi:hypothetical protein